jgi:hypothetical protein
VGAGRETPEDGRVVGRGVLVALCTTFPFLVRRLLRPANGSATVLVLPPSVTCETSRKVCFF